MSRWVRWYEGTCEDGKFRVVARLSRVTLRDVLALWAFILEDAGHLEHRGICRRNEDYMAAILDFAADEVSRILAAMEDAGLISVGHGAITVCNFKKRQFDSDTDQTATRRKQEQRKRDAEMGHDHVTRDTGRSDNREQITEKKDAAGAAVPLVSDPKVDLFRRGKQVLGSNAGGLVKKLLAAKGDNIPLARAALEVAATRADARDYIGAICRKHDPPAGQASTYVDPRL